MTPFEIGIALHYHTRCCDAEEFNVPIGPATAKRFVEDGLLTYHPYDPEMKYHPTDKLHVYVNALIEMEIPVQKWVMPQRKTSL